ncbi:hypothetical protein JZ751_025498 [Albula glossodonta]|uniref:Uncharacterized protein n=1 Tax=Albula glossodonta TaxID=121402 RepID=A0A8T2NH89_9TELE|nr:hypothetical protein JZ751_025498 [Albula glossodonta]
MKTGNKIRIVPITTAVQLQEETLEKDQAGPVNGPVLLLAPPVSLRPMDTSCGRTWREAMTALTAASCFCTETPLIFVCQQ